MAAEPTHLTVTIEQDSPTVIVLVGELDPATAPLLEQAIQDVLDAGATELTVDMAGLTFVDSSGLRALIGLHKQLAPARLRLRQPSPFALQLLSITGLADQFEIVDN